MKWLAFVVVIVAILCSVFLLPDPEVQEDVKRLPNSLQEWHRRGKYATINGKQVFFLSLKCTNPSIEKPPTLALIHGFPSSSYDYSKVLDSLLHLGNVVVHDHVGFGFSDKPQTSFTYSMSEAAENTLALWRSAGITEAHVVAHDMGDSVLTEILARRHRGMLPEYFRSFFKSITFTNGGMKYSQINFRISQTLLKSEMFGPFLNKLSSRLRVSEWMSKMQLKTLWGQIYDPAERDEDIRMLWALNQFRGGNLIMHKLIYYLNDRAHFEFRWFAALKDIEIPTRFVWGDSDAVSPITIPQYFQSLVPGMRPEFVNGAGHFLMLERPDVWVEAVIKPITLL